MAQATNATRLIAVFACAEVAHLLHFPIEIGA